MTHLRRLLLVIAVFAAHVLALPTRSATASTSTQTAERILPWGDQGDGTYRNPILPADYSDPDLIRVGDDFYLVASDFHFMGIQVLHSKDLVNWTIIGRVFDHLGIDPKYNEMRAYSQGTWAPSLRYHNGKFYLYTCTPQEGVLMWSASNPAGPWTDARVVKRISGWEDPCPFWDDSGQAYLVHGQLGAGPLILHKMSPDGTALLDDGAEIYHGIVSEGPKLYKRHGWYYISLPEGGVERGGQTVLRSHNLYGPYERRVVFPDGSPHQGGIVDLDNGESWFIGFKSAGALGRIAYLNPVHWNSDDWPEFGDHGRPVEGGRKPGITGSASLPILHPQTSDSFGTRELQPQWQWNHNPVADAWSLSERPGWLRLRGLPAPDLISARNTLTQKLWGENGTITVQLDPRQLGTGQFAGFAFMSGKVFDTIGVERAGGDLRLRRNAEPSERLAPGIQCVWLRGVYDGTSAQLLYSFDGQAYHELGPKVLLQFSQWKGARAALFCYGSSGGAADFSAFSVKLGDEPVPMALPRTQPIDREAVVARHNPHISKVEPTAPLTVGNGQFAFTVDITGLQTFQDYYYKNGIPLETLARWCWLTEPNPNHYILSDANQSYRQANGSTISLPTTTDTPAAEWLRRNPRLYPVGEVSLQWDKPDGTPFTPADIEDPHQELDLWHGKITSRYKLGGTPVVVTTACDPKSDTLAVTIESDLVAQGRLRAQLAFPRDHDVAIKNTPPLDWSHPELHESVLSGPTAIARSVGSTHYSVTSDHPLVARGPHAYDLRESQRTTLAFTINFAPTAPTHAAPNADDVIRRGAEYWPAFWRAGAMADFGGSTNPLAAKVEERMILSLYLTAVQSASDVPPQESGLTCNTWYGKDHTEMIWWHIAHFILWGHTPMAEKSLSWFIQHLPEARALAASRGLSGARWAKMVGPEDRESPGGNALIVWNQPHLIYLADLILRQSPSPQNLAKYSELVDATADCMASMLTFDAARGLYVLGPPLWIAEEIEDPATSQNPIFELAYWRWGLETAQRWRTRAGLPRNEHWDYILAHFPALPQSDGKYVALESNPDTWSNRASQHDHPEMLMPLGFLPGGPSVDRATMDRTLTAVLHQWDFQAKIFGWDYPTIAMTAARLGRPDEAVEILMRDGPNNHYTPNGHCPQGSDRAQASQLEGRREIAVYLPANGAFLAALDLMLAGWDGNTVSEPGFPKDGTWQIRSEGLSPFP